MLRFKKAIAICLVLLCLTALWALPAGAAEVEPDAAFVPVLRFVACSDTHIKESDDKDVVRIEKMLALAYADADSNPDYQKLDAFLVVGDLTNDGTKAEFDKFQNTVNGALRPETKFLGVVAKNHDGYEMSRKEMRAYYTSLSGNDADFHTVIGGYHFIGLSVSPDKLQHYDLNQLKWLKQQLDAAVKEDPNKPVFVMHHEPVRGTVYGSGIYDGWGVPFFTSILNQYPQAVDFAGHSHYPLNDPRSVWQGNFTEINTGAIYYSEFTVDAYRVYHPADSGDTATFWIVEADAQHNLRLRGMDVEAGAQLCEVLLKNPADPANRDYTPAKRKAASTAPVFADGAQLTLNPTEGGCEVMAPVAQSTDGMPIVLYRVQVKDRFGVPVTKTWTLPPYYRAVQQQTVSFDVGPLAKGTYTVCVTAETAYGVQSAPLEMTVTVDGKNAFFNFFDRIAAWFLKVKDFFEHLFS